MVVGCRYRGIKRGEGLGVEVGGIVCRGGGVMGCIGCSIGSCGSNCGG